MAKSQDTYAKKEKEKNRRKKQQEKDERKRQRKAEKAEGGPKSLEEMFSYVDENGNLSSKPPDPSKKKTVKAEDIVLGASPRNEDPADAIRSGVVKFFNQEKGYGFIIDSATNESVFVHILDLNGQVREQDRVTFELESSPKGMKAVRVKLQ